MTDHASRPARFVTVERAGAVATVFIDRPRVNALSLELLDQLVEAIEALALDLPGAVVLSGRGSSFAAGVDVAELGDPGRVQALVERAGQAFDAVTALPRATVAAISGFALGGGCELALACDLRVVASDARLGFPEVHLGLLPGAGGTQRLPRLVGVGRAKELILTGRSLDADEALAIGLVGQVVPPELVLEVATELAARLAAGATVAQGLAKQAIDRGAELSLAGGLAVERELFLRALGTNDARRGIDSFLADGPGRATFRGD